MSSDPDKKCPDCGLELEPVNIISHGTLGDSQLNYALAETPRGHGYRFAVEGTIAPFMCSGCRRVLLYAQKTE